MTLKLTESVKQCQIPATTRERAHVARMPIPREVVIKAMQDIVLSNAPSVGTGLRGKSLTWQVSVLLPSDSLSSLLTALRPDATKQLIDKAVQPSPAMRAQSFRLG